MWIGQGASQYGQGAAPSEIGLAETLSLMVGRPHMYNRCCSSDEDVYIICKKHSQLPRFATAVVNWPLYVVTANGLKYALLEATIKCTLSLCCTRYVHCLCRQILSRPLSVPRPSWRRDSLQPHRNHCTQSLKTQALLEHYIRNVIHARHAAYDGTLT